MKILHALVGYLAVTALPFLAFASQLAAIDYDGYVNTTQSHIDGALIEQVLDTIAETCQTVSTQNLKDSGALTKRVPGDIIEARQLGVPVIGLIFFLIADVTFALVWIALDDPVRGNDVEFIVEHNWLKSLLETWEIYYRFYQQGHDAV